MSERQAMSTIFFLGATGYLGSQLLVQLARELPGLHIIALVRSPFRDKEKQLKAIYPNLSVVVGTLDDDAVIQEQAAKADIVINTASSNHFPSVKSTLAGLEDNSKSKPGKPPLYIHISGCGIISDNCRGEHVDLADLPENTDIGLDLEKCPPMNTHLDSDKAIVAAGTRKENPVRTIIVFPAWIYGVGEGIQKTTLPVRIFLSMFQKVGYAGTWGKGLNRMNNVHVKDVSNAIFLVLQAAIAGKADEGAEGLYFAASTEPMVTIHDWAAKMGDIMFSKGLLKEGGAKPLPDEVVEPLGYYGWSLFGGNSVVIPKRLAKLGWQVSETEKKSIMDCLQEEIDCALPNQS